VNDYARSRRRLFRGTCAECGRDVAAYVPAGGDGSLYLARAHGIPGTEYPYYKSRCEGTRREIVAGTLH
jgi:hypothetical protein